MPQKITVGFVDSMNPFLIRGSQLFLITEDAISEKDLVSQSCKKSSKRVSKPLKREVEAGWWMGRFGGGGGGSGGGGVTDPFPYPNSYL